MNHLEIYRELKKSNCGYCQERTCMAFALAVARGDRSIGECPHVSPAVARERNGAPQGAGGRQEDLNRRLAPLRRQVADLDFDAVAPGLGARVAGDTLVVPVLGREFCINRDGTVESEIHVIPWVTVPLLRYLLAGGGGASTGQWISFDELSTGPVRGGYFTRRCEEPLRLLIDNAEGLFDQLMGMFSAGGDPGGLADRGWLIHPLPRVPVLILYWRADEDFPSKLRVLFDRSVERFLDPESVYILARGLVEMFERLVTKHGAGPVHSPGPT